MYTLINWVVTIIALVILITCDESVESMDQANDESNLVTAESLIDAFYSFEPAALEAVLTTAAESAPTIMYYQGWAEGGNYKIVDRMPCEFVDSIVVKCSITVEDDPMLALGIDFNVTDTFTITFSENEITTVVNGSNDLQVYFDARDWVRNELPELVEEPCQGYFNGGPTPGDCARVMAEGYRRFAASDDFPQL